MGMLGGLENFFAVFNNVVSTTSYFQDDVIHLQGAPIKNNPPEKNCNSL